KSSDERVKRTAPSQDRACDRREGAERSRASSPGSAAVFAYRPRVEIRRPRAAEKAAAVKIVGEFHPLLCKGDRAAVLDPTNATTGAISSAEKFFARCKKLWARQKCRQKGRRGDPGMLRFAKDRPSVSPLRWEARGKSIGSLRCCHPASSHPSIVCTALATYGLLPAVT